jgi:Asp-tRNA(Asn)/Glu-tRNA(Gln) amidotransferase A subunit family amidase
VPLAVGTQTNGSVIRPASFCGVYGFKPTRGVISRRGILQTSVSLDQVGVFARSLGDVALLSDAMGGYDQTDPASFQGPGRPWPEARRKRRPSNPILPFSTCRFMIVLPAMRAKVWTQSWKRSANR